MLTFKDLTCEDNELINQTSTALINIEDLLGGQLFLEDCDHPWKFFRESHVNKFIN